MAEFIFQINNFIVSSKNATIQLKCYILNDFGNYSCFVFILKLLPLQCRLGKIRRMFVSLDKD